MPEAILDAPITHIRSMDHRGGWDGKELGVEIELDPLQVEAVRAEEAEAVEAFKDEYRRRMEEHKWTKEHVKL